MGGFNNHGAAWWSLCTYDFQYLGYLVQQPENLYMLIAPKQAYYPESLSPEPEDVRDGVGMLLFPSCCPTSITGMHC